MPQSCLANSKDDDAQGLLAKLGVFSHAHEGVVICDAQCRILDANNAMTRITGYAIEEVRGRDPSIFKSGLQDENFYRAMWAALITDGFWEGEVWNRRKDGAIYAERLTISVMRCAAGAVEYYIGSFTDVTLAKSDQEKVKFLAQYDPLTRLPNRVLLADRLEQAMAYTLRNGGLLAVCYLDLYGLKTANDEYGFAGGDRILIETSSRLKAHLRDSDTVARMGGGEFVLLLHDAGSLEDCYKTAQRVLDAIAIPIPVPVSEDHPDRLASAIVTANMGITLFPKDSGDAYGLLRHADRAMYAAKAKGNNCFVMYDPSHDMKTREHRELLERIRDGIRKGEFQLFYQPKVDMRDGSLLGFEGLARWVRADGISPPAEFLPAIEKTDVDIEFGRWVIAEGLRQVEMWMAEDFRCTVSVNVSATHLLLPGFCDELQAQLATLRTASPSQLEIEIVESAALDDIDAAIKVFERCRAMGVKIALDDFGTGYSSLSYFRRFPVDTIKVDRMFVQNMQDDANDKAIVESVTGLAGAFRRTVIAEGVETEAQAQMLKDLGCFIGQGFGIARPMPASAVREWVAGMRDNPCCRPAAQ